MVVYRTAEIPMTSSDFNVIHPLQALQIVIFTVVKQLTRLHSLFSSRP